VRIHSIQRETNKAETLLRKSTSVIARLDENADVQITSIEVHPVFLVAFIHSFVQPVLFADQSLIHNTYYSPPIPDRDIQVLFQTFLI
jgi:hypothetical protein